MKRAPKHLEETGRRFWLDVLADFDLTEHHHLKLLQGCCECLDRIAEAQAATREHGAYVVDRFKTLKPHPALKIEAQNRTLFARLLRELALDVETPPEVRPPRLAG